VKRLVAGILLLALATSGSVARAQYPPNVGNGRVTRSELKQCQCTLFSGDGFKPGAVVTVRDKAPGGGTRVVGTVTADAKGEFKLKVCFDETSIQGEHTLSGRGAAPSGTREVNATVVVEGSVCFKKGDEVHSSNAVGSPDGGQEPGAGSGSGSGSGSGPDVGGVDLPRTGADYVLPGLLAGFLLVVIGTTIARLTGRRRRLAAS
jgi:hypothetical protein